MANEYPPNKLKAQAVFGVDNLGNYVAPTLNGSTSSDLSTTITLGGTAQALLAADATRAEVTIGNPDASEDLWYALNGVTAIINGTGSIKLAPGVTHTITGVIAQTAISIIGATTAHKITAGKVV